MLGGTIGFHAKIDTLKVDIVAGSANNQVAETRHGKALHERGIVYAPDYVINAGGMCNVYGELKGWDMWGITFANTSRRRAPA